MEHQQNRVVFNNTADQYVKGEDVTAFFTIPDGIKDVSNEDQIVLLRVGCTDIKKCVAYAPVKFNTSESMRHGTAIFPSSSLSVTNDEFYQFCYINKNTKNLGTSIPFQLNCSLDDIDLLSNISGERSKTSSLVEFDDNDDIIIINSLESQKNTPTMSYKTPSDQEENRLRSQLAVTIQFAKDQASQIVDLERRLMQANDIAKKSHERQIFLEQQLRDVTLTSEKHLKSLQGQLNESLKISNQRQACLEQQLRDSTLKIQFAKDQALQIVDLERRLMQANDIAKKSHERQLFLEQQLRDSTLTSEKHLKSLQGQFNESVKMSNQRQACLEQQLRDLTLTSEKYQRSMQGQLNAYSKQVIQQNSIEINPDQQAYMTLKNSLTEIEKHCIKYQKSEIDLKRQLNTYQNLHNDLQHQIQYLTVRLSMSAEQYQVLSSKYNALECKTERSDTKNQLLSNENQQKSESISTRSSFTDVETGQRSSFYWQLPQ